MNPAPKIHRDFADLMADHFAHHPAGTGKIQKLAVDAGFSCPNRDGTVGRGGCTYCNNRSFSPSYCSPKLSVTEQLAKGREFFARKYPHMHYLAYFQAYTGTHAPHQRLMELYREALAAPGIVGLIIGTRPDCMPPALLADLADLRRSGTFIMVEYGAESSHDSTLRLVNRCHTWADTADAVRRTSDAGLVVGLHLINGLPGESDEMMLQTVDRINALPVDTVKFHQLQLLHGTRMAADVAAGHYTVRSWTPQEYAALCVRLLRRLRPDIAVERLVSQSPPDMLITPRWALKNYQFQALVERLYRTTP